MTKIIQAIALVVALHTGNITLAGLPDLDAVITDVNQYREHHIAMNRSPLNLLVYSHIFGKESYFKKALKEAPTSHLSDKARERANLAAIGLMPLDILMFPINLIGFAGGFLHNHIIGTDYKQNSFTETRDILLAIKKGKLGHVQFQRLKDRLTKKLERDVSNEEVAASVLINISEKELTDIDKEKNEVFYKEFGYYRPEGMRQFSVPHGMSAMVDACVKVLSLLQRK